MAALSGILSRSGASGTHAVHRMLSAAPHRGSHVEVISLGRGVLGVTNDDARREASLAQSGTFAVAFSGVLDNVDELIQRGVIAGDVLPQTPAEAVLRGFQKAGQSTAGLLRGNFACLVTDGTRMWCFRDQIGFEMLFYRDDPTGFYAATEAKQVIAGAGLSPEPDLDVVSMLFYSDLEDPTRCALRGVTRLVPATLLVVGGGSLRQERYWDPRHLLETSKLTPGETLERFRALFTQAVRRTLTGRDAVALSGGIDSPPIAAVAAREYVQRFGRPIEAISEVYPSFPSVDETRYIELVAGRLAIPLHTYEPGRQRLDRLQEWVKLFDGPWTTTAPEGTAARCRVAVNLGFQTILTGHFAEHVAAAGQVALLTHLLWNGRLGAAARYLASRRAAGAGRRTLARHVLDALAPRFIVARRNRRRPMLPMPPWLDSRRISERDGRAALPVRKRWAAFQFPFFGASSSGEADIYSHAVCGVRPRRPWADVDLWEFFISLRAEVKFPDWRMKGFLRNALRGDVPDEILDRTDKTNTNEYVRKMCLDYAALRRWLSSPAYRLDGIDYPLLVKHLEQENMSLAHYMWAKDLAAVHAFLDLWR